MTRKVLLNGVRLIVFVALLISFLQPMTVAHAALGWVGNQNPAVGSTTYKTVGNSLTVSVEVYKAGVTPGAGQGANITCTLNYATVPYFSGRGITFRRIPCPIAERRAIMMFTRSR